MYSRGERSKGGEKMSEEKGPVKYHIGLERAPTFQKTYATQLSVVDTGKDVRIMAFNEKFLLPGPNGEVINTFLCEHMFIMSPETAYVMMKNLQDVLKSHEAAILATNPDLKEMPEKEKELKEKHDQQKKNIKKRVEEQKKQVESLYA